MNKLWEGFASVRSVKLINAAAVTEIKQLVSLLKSFGTVEDRFSESQEEERTRFTENMVGLAGWFGAEFKPGLQQANDFFTKWAASSVQANSEDGVAMSMAELAKKFIPMEKVSLPAELDESFQLQCSMASSVVSGC